VRGPSEAESLLDTRILAAIPQLSKGRAKRYGLASPTAVGRD